MGLTKGKTNNPNGRPLGAKNKISEKTRSMMADFVNANIEDIQAEYDKLEPKEKLYFFEKILKYILPPPVMNEDSNKINVVFTEEFQKML